MELTRESTCREIEVTEMEKEGARVPCEKRANLILNRFAGVRLPRNDSKESFDYDRLQLERQDSGSGYGLNGATTTLPGSQCLASASDCMPP